MPKCRCDLLFLSLQLPINPWAEPLHSQASVICCRAINSCFRELLRFSLNAEYLVDVTSKNEQYSSREHFDFDICDTILYCH